MMPELRNILLVQLGDIGDVVLTTPTIRAVKENCPTARISIMVRKPYGSLLAADPNLFEVIESDRINGSLLQLVQGYIAFALRLRQARYDLVIDLRTGDRGAILTFLTGAPVRIGWRDGKLQFWKRIPYTEVLQNIPYAPPPTHPGAEQSLRIVRALGMDTHDAMPKLSIAPKARLYALNLLKDCGLTLNQRFFTVNPCSRWKYKEWGYTKWGELIDLLWQKYRLPALLVGAPEDKTATDIVEAGRNGYVFNLAGKTTLGELAAIISESTFHLGIDSAASHIAFSVGTPTVTIFGSGNWKGWTNADSMHRIVTANMPCVPCGRKGCNDSGMSRCLDDLEVDVVLKSTEELLEAISPSGRSVSS
jgi:lipopolysaccharide heptosyltransferase III